MAITLSKGQKVSLTKGNPGLKHLVVGLGWDTNKYDGGFDFDLDSAAFLLGKSGKVIHSIRTIVQASSYLKDNKKVKINIDSI